MSVSLKTHQEVFELMASINGKILNPSSFSHGTFTVILPPEYQAMAFSIMNLYRHIGWNCRITYVGPPGYRQEAIMFFVYD